MPTMKEAIVVKGPKVTVQDAEIPEPKADQVVIKVIVSGSNPKDWYVQYYYMDSLNPLCHPRHPLSNPTCH
jgi:NADPH2:quinone reductase